MREYILLLDLAKEAELPAPPHDTPARLSGR
jgi:hypothetical protein